MERDSWNWAFLKTFSDGLWDPIVDAKDDIDRTAHIVDRVDGELDRTGEGLDLPRKTDETDANYLARIKGDLQQRIAQQNPVFLTRLTETLIRGSEGDVKLVENEDANDASKRDAYFYVQVKSETLEENFDAPFDDLLSDIADTLDDAAGAGVEVATVLVSGAEWGSASFDSDDVYGS